MISLHNPIVRELIVANDPPVNRTPDRGQRSSPRRHQHNLLTAKDRMTNEMKQLGTRDSSPTDSQRRINVVLIDSSLLDRLISREATVENPSTADTNELRTKEEGAETAHRRHESQPGNPRTVTENPSRNNSFDERGHRPVPCYSGRLNLLYKPSITSVSYCILLLGEGLLSDDDRIQNKVTELDEG